MTDGGDQWARKTGRSKAVIMEAGETAEMEEDVMTEELSEDDTNEAGVEEVDLDDRQISTRWEQGGNKVRRRTFFDIFEEDQLSEEGEEGHRDIVQKHRKNCECCPGHHLIVDHYSSA